MAAGRCSCSLSNPGLSVGKMSPAGLAGEELESLTYERDWLDLKSLENSAQKGGNLFNDASDEWEHIPTEIVKNLCQ
jgi:hypothetical protein